MHLLAVGKRDAQCIHELPGADTDMSNGPLAVLPGSHNRPLYDLYGVDGNWAGCLNDEDAATIDLSKVDYLTGPAGSITIHNCRALHYSPSSTSPEPRPLHETVQPPRVCISRWGS